MTATNQSKNGRALELIRLCKKWNKVKNAKTIPSYLLETLIINHCDAETELSQWIDLRFRDALEYISAHIYSSVYDMKEIQGDINDLSLTDRYSIQQKAQADYIKACEASNAERQEKDQKKAINKWGEILGSDFPTYG